MPTGKRDRMNFSERLEGARGQLVAAVGAVHGDGAIQTFRFAINRIVESMPQRQTQPGRAHDGRAIAQLLDRAAQLDYSTLRILGRNDGDGFQAALRLSHSDRKRSRCRPRQSATA